MILRFLACFVCCLTSAAQAQPVPVISGEHADFSRLVVLFDIAHDWTFGRVPGGYELRTNANNSQFFDRQIFSFIPRSRVESVTFPGPGRMILAVTCACSADVFDIRQGRLAIDIKDGAARDNSRFEANLPELPPGATWQRTATLRDDEQNVSFGFEADPDYVDDVVALLQKNFPTFAPPQVTASGPARENAGTMPESDRLKANVEKSTTFDLPDDKRPPAPARQRTSLEVFDPRLRDSTVGEAPEGESTENSMFAAPDTGKTPHSRQIGPILSSWPRDWDQVLPAPNGPKSERVDQAQTELLEQLSRAVAQGIVQLDIPTSAEVFERNVSGGHSSDAGNMSTAIMPESGPQMPRPAEQLRIETVMDRDAIHTVENIAATDLGLPCLGDDLTQIADWGPPAGSAAAFSDLRAKILLEFDTPDTASVSELARRYLYLGFGAEMVNLISSFPVQIDGADILLQMADIVDHGSTLRPGRLLSQLTCSTPAAMWAVLLQPKIPRGVDIDTNQVLQTFAGLPAHLRRQLGPGLVDRFLVDNKADIAASLSDIIDRATDERDAKFQMMQAQIAAFEGDEKSSQAALRKVVATGSPVAPLAMAVLLESTLALGGVIDTRTAILADAMATENRGTEIGSRLTIVAIRAYAASGQFDITFERISESVGGGLITLKQAEILTTEAHTQNAMNSSDGDFLRVLYQTPLANNRGSPGQMVAARMVASRLFDLGLPAIAKKIYQTNSVEMNVSDQQFMARTDLALGDVKSAIQRLIKYDDAESVLIRAQINEFSRSFDAAAQLYGSLEMTDRRHSVAWRAGDWAVVAEIGTEPRAQFANLVIASPLADAALGSEDGDGRENTPDVAANSPTLAAGKKILADSQMIRGLVSELLKPVEE